MEESFHFFSISTLRSPSKPRSLTPVFPKILSPSQNAPPRLRSHALSAKAPISLPEKPSIIPKIPSVPPDPTSPFREKMLFLESLGLDLFTLIESHPPIVSADPEAIRSTVNFLRSLGFNATDLRRIFGMCPDVLEAAPPALTPVLKFLLQEAGVAGHDLRRAVNRRPRLLVSDVATRLRPTLYFLRALGVPELHKHTHFLSCSVERKLIPRLEFLERSGFSPQEARAMARRFPQLFCYSIQGNLEPKLGFLVKEMGRELREVREFPQYFSFSLEKRIKPRHWRCAQKGVFLPLPALLKPSDQEFSARFEVCVSSSPPLRWSPLWHEGLSSHS